MNAILRIHYTDILLPMSVATKVMELLSKGQEIDHVYESGSECYKLKGEVPMELKTLPRKARLSDGTDLHRPAPKPRKARPLALPDPNRVLRLD